jgi:nitrogen regulatory protein PII
MEDGEANRRAGAARGGQPASAGVVKVEAVVLRDRVEQVMEQVEQRAGHVGVTVVEAIGHGRQPGITHEYRGRVFESRFLPKALMVFIVAAPRVEAVVEAIIETARSGNESGDGIVWTSDVGQAWHNRTGARLADELHVGI